VWCTNEQHGSSRAHPAGSRASSNTLLPRRGLRPLATADREIGLGEGRWTALRRPDGRLPGRRQTQTLYATSVAAANGIRVDHRASAPPAESKHRWVHSRRAPPRSLLCRTRPRPRRGARPASPRGMVRRTATRSPTQRGAFSRFFANQRHENLFSRHGVFSGNRTVETRAYEWVQSVRWPPFVSPGGAFGKRRRHRQPSPAQQQAPGRCSDGESQSFRTFQPRAYRRPPGLSRLWKCACRRSARGCTMASPCVKAREWAAFAARDRLARVSQDLLLLMRRITPVSRCRGATRRWPPRARSSVSSEGRWTPLRRPAVGSRGVVKQ
jgi:hypothetical protein